MEFFGFSFVFDNNVGLSISALLNFERPMFHIRLHNGIVEFSANQSLGVKNGVVRVFGILVFGSVSNQSFSFSKGDV